jgi:hypothetical protein
MSTPTRVLYDDETALEVLVDDKHNVSISSGDREYWRQFFLVLTVVRILLSVADDGCGVDCCYGGCCHYFSVVEG